MPRCVVIQPFDSDEFDKRYDDVLKPAIEAAGLEPYRVDRDYGASIPINEVLKQLKESDVCLAEISTDNPNVWFEFGYAFAYHQEEVAIICSKARIEEKRLPFDVHHLKAIPYESHSPRDFRKLESETTKRLLAILENKKKGRGSCRDRSSSDGDFADYEIASLRVVAGFVDEPNAGITPFEFHKRMVRSGFSRADGNLALDSLAERGMLERFDDETWDGESFLAYRLTAGGRTWLRVNREVTRTDDDLPF